MLEQCRNAKERWGGVHSLIDRWLHERKELITSLFALHDQSEFAPADTPVADRLARFCEVLVDYVSAGHFEVYQQLISEARAFNDADLDKTDRVIRSLNASTERVLAFNDHYSDPETAHRHMAELDTLVSELAGELDDRFALEDDLIQDLHEAHRERALSDH